MKRKQVEYQFESLDQMQEYLDNMEKDKEEKHNMNVSTPLKICQPTDVRKTKQTRKTKKRKKESIQEEEEEEEEEADGQEEEEDSNNNVKQSNSTKKQTNKKQKYEKQKNEDGSTKEEQQKIPKMDFIQGSELYNLYSFPKTSLPRSIWEQHKKSLTLIPINEYEERKRPKHWNKTTTVSAKNAMYCFAETDKFYAVPPAYGIEMFGPPQTDKRPYGRDLHSDVRFEGQLFDEKGLINQKRIVEVVSNHCKDTQSGGIIDLPTNSGKTVVGSKLIELIKKRAIWVVPAEALMDQCEQRMKTFLPNARIGRIRGPVFDIEDKDIVFAMVQSLAKHDYGETNIKRLHELFGLAIFDEIHLMAAPVFSKAIEVLSPIRIKIGMTATLKRPDGMEGMLLWMIGKVLISIPPVNVASSVTDVQKVTFRDGEQKLSFTKYKGETVPNFAGMTNDLCEDTKRNEALVDIISQLCFNGRKVLVFTTRIKHCETLLEMLEARRDCPRPVQDVVQKSLKSWNLPDPMMADEIVDGAFNTMKNKRIKIFKQGMKKKERERIDRVPHDCLIGTGLDLSYIDTLVLADPVKSNMQTIGRLRFKMGQTKRFLIVDFVDCFSIFQSQAAKRTQTYKQKELVMLKSKDWQDFVEELEKRDKYFIPNSNESIVLEKNRQDK